MAIDSGSRQFARGWSSHSTRRLRCAGLLLTAVLGLGASGCVTTARAPVDLQQFCTPERSLLGTWHRRKSGQFGPASLWLTFGCDCRYKTFLRFILVNRYHEEGSYAVHRDRIVFTRADGTTTVWDFTIEEGRLLLVEEGEIEIYERVREQDCPVEPKI